MKIEIDYFPYADERTPCGAQIEHQGVKVYGYGATWEQARERVLDRLKGKLRVNAPPRETVELPEAEPDKDELPF